MARTLYFEGAGMPGSHCGDLGNHRIRTSFRNDGGTDFFVEVMLHRGARDWRRLHPEFDGIPDLGYVSECSILTGDPREPEREHSTRTTVIPFTKEGVLGYVNSVLGCSFDSVEVAPDNAGYRAVRPASASSPISFNRGDEFVVDLESTARADKIEAYWLAKQRKAGERHPAVGVWRDVRDPGLLHVANHRKCGLGDFDYRIDRPDWKATETAVG